MVRLAVLAGTILWAAAVTVAIGIWVVPLIGDAAGVGPPDGTVTVQSCFETVDSNGDSDGFACTGTITPRGATAPTGTVTVDTRGKYRSGTALDVRAVGSRYQEPSVTLLMKWVFLALLGAAFGWPPLIWAALSNWKEALSVDDLLFPQLILIFCTGVLGIVLLIIGGVIDTIRA